MKGTKLNERFRSSETIEKAEVNEKNLIFCIPTKITLISWIMFHLNKYQCKTICLEKK